MPDETKATAVNEFRFDPFAIERAAKQAVREALLRHKLLGESIVVVGENGGPVWVAAKDIQVPDAPEPDRPVEQRKQAG